MLQAAAPASLVKPSGRLEREVAPDLGLAGAAQLGIKVSSHQKPSSALPPSASRPTPSASQRSHAQASTSGRCATYWFSYVTKSFRLNLLIVECLSCLLTYCDMLVPALPLRFCASSTTSQLLKAATDQKVSKMLLTVRVMTCSDPHSLLRLRPYACAASNDHVQCHAQPSTSGSSLLVPS